MSDKQKYRVTFKCDCGAVETKAMLSPNPDLSKVKCGECKKKAKKTIFHRIGDGPISEAEAQLTEKPKKFDERNYPNTIYKCADCFSITKIFQEVGEKNLTECPACDGPNIKYRGHISKDISTESSNRNKCVDKTANIVMEDYKLGNLKDDVKVGESMAPRLEPKLQAAADGMFAGGKRKGAAVDTAKLARRALAGGMRDMRADPVRMLHQAESRGRA